MTRRIASSVAVLASLEVRLPDQVDDVVVIERVDHVLEQALPLLRRLALRQRCDRIEYELVRPCVVARQHACGLSGYHDLPRRDWPVRDYDICAINRWDSSVAIGRLLK